MKEKLDKFFNRITNYYGQNFEISLEMLNDCTLVPIETKRWKLKNNERKWINKNISLYGKKTEHNFFKLNVPFTTEAQKLIALIKFHADIKNECISKEKLFKLEVCSTKVYGDNYEKLVNKFQKA